MNRKLWGDDIINSLIWIFIRNWSSSVFRKKIEISKCHNFLISYPIFIIFALFCRELFSFSFKIYQILEWISFCCSVFSVSQEPLQYVPIDLLQTPPADPKTLTTTYPQEYLTNLHIRDKVHVCSQLLNGILWNGNNLWPCITKPPKSRQTWIFS